MALDHQFIGMPISGGGDRRLVPHGRPCPSSPAADWKDGEGRGWLYSKAFGSILRAAGVLLLTATALLGLSGSSATAQEPPNIALAVIIDNSGSMNGTDPSNLRFAAASQLADLLESGDEISVVLFSDASTVPLPLTKVTDAASKTLIKSKLAPVALQGNTNMREGLGAGLTQLEKAT